MKSALATLLILLPGSAAAVDVTLNWRDSHQTGRTEESTFAARWRRESLIARQAIRPLESHLLLDLNFRAQRETSGSDATGVDVESEREIWQPDASLAWRTRRLTVGVKGNRLEQRATGAIASSPEATRIQYGAWLEAKPAERTRFSSNWVHTTSEDRDAFDVTTETRQSSGFVNVEHGLSEDWRFDYNFSGVSSDLTARSTNRRQYTHGFQIQGDPSFLDERLDTSFRLHSRLFTQKIDSGGDELTVLRTPLRVGLLLDDTPEVHDPLEEEVTPIGGLADGDRETLTILDIGDDAPVVREFGGDYRNVRYDFGENEEFASALLFVNERLIDPALVEWRVYVSDDPEGAQWEEVGPERASVRWREWATILQGWEVTFVEGVSGRYLKLVDVKRGETVPHLFLTELEVYVRDLEALTKTEEDSQSHEFETTLGYDLTPSVRLGWRSRVGRRMFEDSLRDLDELDNGFTTTWTGGRYRLSGGWANQRVASDLRRNTDVTTWQASAARLRTDSFGSKLSWSLTDDNSGDFDRVTQSIALNSTWRAAPRLTLTQGLSHGWRHDRVLDDRSRSWSVSHRLRSTPWTTFSLDLDRSDRWVDVEAGTGFQNFSDSGAQASWTPVSQVTVAADARYYERRTTDWTSRQSVTWSPLTDGDVTLRLSGTGYRDSRDDVWRIGAGVLSEWRVRPGLRAMASVDTQRYRLRGIDNTPVGTQVHISWTL